MFTDAFGGVEIGSQSGEDGRPETAIARPLGIFHRADKLWTHPDDILRKLGLFSERTARSPERLQAIVDILH